MSIEYEVILENATDEEVADFVGAMGGMEEGTTISDIKKGIRVRNRYVEHYKPNK